MLTKEPVWSFILTSNLELFSIFVMLDLETKSILFVTGFAGPSIQALTPSRLAEVTFGCGCDTYLNLCMLL